ncbi:MAG: CvpA family protein [Chloroflexi bacterium]|nr:CvpA family protein [Chloroflexota bacterium]
MNALDLVLVTVVATFTCVGYTQGFLRQAVNLGAVYLSLVLAAQYHLLVGRWLSWFFSADATPRAAVGFLLVFLWASLFLGWVIRRVYPTMRVLSLGIMDNSAGAAVGLLTGLGVACMATIILGFLLAVPWPDSDPLRTALASATKGSNVLPLVALCAPVLQHSLSLWFPSGVPAIFSFFS